jgi:ADP-ribose pyrophosphatase YjhB (NUDIX family)
VTVALAVATLVIHPSIRFCAHCGTALKRRWSARERRSRRICPQCNTVAYRSPNVLVTTIVTCQDQVLLCQRAEPPAQGRWNAPTGFMECGETLEEAAAREIQEETEVRLDPDELRLYAVSTLRNISEVYVSFRAVVKDPWVNCGPECLQIRYFSEQEFPWDGLAYPEMIGFFKLFFRERHAGAFSIHQTHLDSLEIARSSYRIAEMQSVKEARAFRRGKRQPRSEGA